MYTTCIDDQIDNQLFEQPFRPIKGDIIDFHADFYVVVSVVINPRRTNCVNIVVEKKE